ncbi:MAG: alpha-L-arabinofuranosidase C-terminal domain-containing protein [Bacteroidaceae bacterium]|jgi:alpha-L-arabinofuranosidase
MESFHGIIIKPFTRFFCCIFLAIALSSTSTAQLVDTYQITTKEISRSPISPLLYGNFIELGYGVQAEAMWSEMFFNRSFEAFYPYRSINKAWYDLYLDEKHPEKGYEKDWSKFDWYHSGYEHNEWYAAPGKAESPSIITDSSTFFHSAPDGSLSLTPMPGGSGHGTQCLQVTNNTDQQWRAVAQDGKLFHKGVRYLFSGMMKANGQPVNAEIRIYPQGQWNKPLQVIPLHITDDKFTLQSASFNKSNYSGYTTFSLWIPPHASILLDNFSMKPDNAYYGWRPDVVKTFQEVNPKIVRFPGGCFASFYNWRNGIGPYSERKPQPSYFWGGLNYNDVGIAEFAMLCKAAGAEKQMCVNVYNPSKKLYDIDFPDGEDRIPFGARFPEFMSLHEGAQSAADLVAYCNAKAGTNKMADLRSSHGYKEPLNVKYWELDNEVHRWFEPLDYADAVVVYSKAMKAIDPTIKIGMSSYGSRPGKKSFHESFEDMLAIAGPYIDFIADRGDGEEISASMLQKVRQYNAQHGTHIKYCDTEWLAYNTDVKRDAYNMASSSGGATKSFMFSKWFYALNLCKNFMAFQRLGDDVGFVNFNNLANTHSQSAMETPKEGAFLTACGKVLQLFSRTPAAYVLQLKNYAPKESDDYQVQAAWNNDRTQLVLYICNRTKEKRTANFDCSQLNKSFKTVSLSMLSADGPLVMNTSKNHDAIKRTDKILQVNDPHSFSFKIPPYSFLQLVLK